ncbi:MAG TPA: RNA 2',3'-cyclic phosphodiesterase [Gammaproteobacteria bacterium]|nr:RNA 2',3'-cyclic phosphodiesterase [Gammaproteobacteria bacterium]
MSRATARQSAAPPSPGLCAAFSTTSEATLRLFFALWPDPDTREAIARATCEAVERAGGRAVPVVNYHLTLAFLGEQPERLLTALARMAAEVEPPRGRLRLDRLGCFEKAGVLWLGPERTPAPLRAWVRTFFAALASFGIAAERRPFAAHLTLARKIRCAPKLPPARAVYWEYEGFALVESVRGREGSEYRVLAEWPAGARGCPVK